MGTTVTFNDNDERDQKILRDIEKYQKKKGLRYRIDAVRNLCEMALKVEKITDGKDE